jgi:hypothetical protein
MRLPVALFALMLATTGTTSSRADIFVATETMMTDQTMNNLTLGDLFGADASSPLHFTSHVATDGSSFSYELLPGSTFKGMSLTMSASGTFDVASGAWTTNMSGQLGSTRFETKGDGELHKNSDGTYTQELNKDKYGFDLNGNMTKIGDVHDTVTYDPNKGTSKGALYKTKLDDSKVAGSDYTEDDHKDKDTGKWVDGIKPVSIGPATEDSVYASGTSPSTGGGGSFTAHVVPEPTAFALAGLGGLALAGYGWRRNRRPVA